MAKPSPGTSIATTSLTSGLIAAWPFWENTGLPKEIIANVSPTANTGFTWGSGPDGPAGVFNGSTTDLTYSSVPTVGPAMSIALRINITTVQNAAFIEREYVNSTWEFLLGGSGEQKWRGGSADNRNSHNYPLDAETWYSLIISDGGAVTSVPNDTVLYVDGVSETNNAEGTSVLPVASTDPVHIGNYDASGYYFAGLIDYIYIWNRVITSGEAASIHADPWQIFSSSTPTTTSPLAIMMDF